MKIGILNELVTGITCQVTFAGSHLTPCGSGSANPAESQPLFLKWEITRDTPVTLHFTFPKTCFIDRATLKLGEKTALTSAALSLGSQQFPAHTAETGKTIAARQIDLEAGVLCDGIDLTVCADFSNLDIQSVTFHGALEDRIDLFPTPKSVTPGDELLPLSRFGSCHADCDEAKRAGQILKEKFFERTGITLTEDSNGDILLITDASVPADGCRLEVNRDGARISASNLRGFVYGAETFLKLVTADGIPAVTVDDAPMVPFRGVHLFIPSEDKMEFARRLIKYCLSPLGYNTVILQVSGGMIYESHPNISAAFANAVSMHAQGKWPAFPHSGVAEGKPITKAMLKDYIAYIRSFGIDVIPEVQSLGHVQYMTHAYPEIAEIDMDEETVRVDTREEDQLPSKFYRHCYCPSNPRSYEILFDIIDEIIEVFEPKEYVHMGHDEVREIGLCRKCRQQSPADLFTSDVCKIHDYLASKGLKMMIWGDMLQPVSKYLTPPAIDRIPKDIVMLDFIWYFHLDKDIEDNLLAKDFQVIYGNLYSSHFPRYESRIRKDGILGGQISAWVATSEYEMQKEGKLYDIFLTAQMLWSESYRKEFALSYDRMISALMPNLRENLNGIRYPSRQKEARTQVLAVVPEASEIVIGRRFDSLVFHHAALRNITRLPWSQLDVVGSYLLTYEDGETEEIPITYSGNIGFYGRRQNAPLSHKLYRHTGYAATYYADSETTFSEKGEAQTVFRLEYLPKQNKPIRSVTLLENPNFDPRIRLFRLEGITAE